MDVREFFGKYAEEYAKSESHAKGSDLDVLIRLLSPQRDQKALDLATGTGFTAVALAKHVSWVSGLDKTEQMLEQARKYAKEENVNNVTFVTGDVEEMPFDPESFDIVTSRRAPHHFVDKNKFLVEAVRVMKNGGLLGISDMVIPEGDSDDGFNALERIRDPSHVRAESIEGWKLLFSEVGLQLIEVIGTEERIKFEKWIYPLEVDSDEGKKSLAFLENSSDAFKKVIGYEQEDRSFIKRRGIIVAQKT